MTVDQLRDKLAEARYEAITVKMDGLRLSILESRRQAQANHEAMMQRLDALIETKAGV